MGSGAAQISAAPVFLRYYNFSGAEWFFRTLYQHDPNGHTVHQQ